MINNVQGAYEATRYLAKMGHTQMRYLKSSVPINNFDERFEGYQKGLLHSNLSFNPDWVFRLEPTMEAAGLSFQKSIRRPLPTAFFADNDIIAIGAMKALKEAGLRIPQDVSVVGFDNLPMCAMMQPAMTTIQVPKRQLGKYAVNLLIQRIGEPAEDFVKIEVGTHLIKRESVRNLKPDV